MRTGLTWQGPCLQSQLWLLCPWVSCPQVVVPGMHQEAQPGVRATSSENLNQLLARVFQSLLSASVGAALPSCCWVSVCSSM